MWFILLILFIIFIGAPLFRVWRVVHRARRQMRDLDEAFRRAGFQNPFGTPEDREEQRRREQTSRRGGWSAAPEKRKKIDRDTGEYVKFTEVKVTESQTTSPEDAASGQSSASSTDFRREEQITDVTWEDIK